MTQEPEIPAEVRTAFAAGPGEEPPLGLTAAGLLGSGRRALRRRRAVGTGVTAVAVAAVLGAAAVLVPGGAGGSTTETAGRPTARPTTAAPTPVTPPVTGDQALQARRLTGLLAAAVRVPPGGELHGGVSPRVGPLEFVPNQHGYKAAAEVWDRVGTGSLLVWVNPPRDPTGDPCAAVPECTTWNTDDGRMVRLTRRTGAAVTYDVRLIRPDGTGVLAYAGNYGLDDQEGSRTTRLTPPFSQTDLERIVRLPGLRVG